VALDKFVRCRVSAVLIVVAAVVGSSACTPSAFPQPPLFTIPAQPTVPAPSIRSAGLVVATAPAAEGTPRLAVRVSARYPATVLYALDRATPSGGADERYRHWLFGEEPAPAWFAAYAAWRGTWNVSRDSGNGHYDPYDACSFQAETLDELIACATPLIAASDLERVREALQQTAALLRPRWLELEPISSQQERELEALIRGEQGTQLARELARAVRLPDSEHLTFDVVLVARPPGTLSRAHQSGSFLVVEMVDDRPISSHAHVLFHELAHLAARHAPGREALEQAFVGRGLRGLVAANLWDETFATAFGNGLAARELDPTFAPDRSLYDDPAIDALGRALYLRWAAGNPVTLDATLAEQLLELVDSIWPPERWRMIDLFARLEILSEEREAALTLQQGLRPRAVQRWVPLPPGVTFRPLFPPPLPRLILATLPTLQSRPDVLQVFGLDAASVRARLFQHGSSLYWLHGDDDPRILLTARTHEGLVQAARVFAALPRPPGPGWTALQTAKETSDPPATRSGRPGQVR